MKAIYCDKGPTIVTVDGEFAFQVFGFFGRSEEEAMLQLMQVLQELILHNKDKTLVWRLFPVCEKSQIDNIWQARMRLVFIPGDNDAPST